MLLKNSISHNYLQNFSHIEKTIQKICQIDYKYHKRSKKIKLLYFK